MQTKFLLTSSLLTSSHSNYYCYRPVRPRTKLSMALGLLPRFRRPDLWSDIMGVKGQGAVRISHIPESREILPNFAAVDKVHISANSTN